LEPFRVGFDAGTTTSTPALNIVKFVSMEQAQPVIGQTIDSLVDEWTADPTFAKEMREARMRRSEKASATERHSLKGLRLSRGLSQLELSRLVGTSQPHIARIEKGTSCPTFETGRRIARALQVDMNALDAALPSVNDCVEIIA
jgi:DNA-binding XRE family transcriptional regulator